MADIVYWKEEYEREVAHLSSLVSKTSSLVSSSNAKVIGAAAAECDAKVARLREVKKSFGLELRLVKDRTAKAEYDALAKALDEKVNTLGNELKQARTSQSRLELMQGSKNGGESAVEALFANPYATDGKTNDDLLSGANLLQDKTLDSLGEIWIRERGRNRERERERQEKESGGKDAHTHIQSRTLTNTQNSSHACLLFSSLHFSSLFALIQHTFQQDERGT